MVEHLAADGTVTLAGRTDFGAPLKAIPKKLWKSSRLFLTMDSFDNIKQVQMVSKSDPKTVIMVGLMADYSQIHGAIH